MKRFMLIHCGFEMPTPEIMQAWNDWFASISEIQIESGGFCNGREITKGGTQELPWDTQALTGFNIIEAADVEAAEKIASTNPFITSIKIYELRTAE